MTKLAMNHSCLSQYNSDLDRWIINAVESGVKDFWQLTSALPGVYPTVAREAVDRLVMESSIPRYVTVEKPSPVSDSDLGLEVPGLPRPHPLSSDWRFTRKTAAELLERVIISAGPTGAAALIGAPSVFFLVTLEEVPCRITLLDQNPLLADRLPCSALGTMFRCCDVKRDAIDIPSVQTVLADPPWYEDDAMGFLRTSARVCADQGTVFLSFAPDGVRPGIAEERQRIIDGATRLGLRFVGIEPLALSYATPFFESNALRAAQFKHVPSAWRGGDLLLFRRNANILPKEDNWTSGVSPWREATISGISLRVRWDDRREFVDPRLIQLVPGDVLPTVSRREVLGEAADVWTTGNRIFRCEGKNILLIILKALGEGVDPYEAIQQSLRCRLDKRASALVASVVAQVGKIVETESQEWSIYNGRA